MPVSAKIIEDSAFFVDVTHQGPKEVRLTTMQIRYPRVAHAEFMTHRVFSRNASSSRAIPVSKLIDEAEFDPALPMHIGKNQKGMQAHEEVSDSDADRFMDLWNESRLHAISTAKQMSQMGVHKQVVNRILEPYTHISVIVTSTTYSNFFALRTHKDAYPEIQALAGAMLDVYRASKPVDRTGGWHLPYVSEDDRSRFDISDLLKMSVARCARVSYLKHDGGAPELSDDIRLHNMLADSGHWSPFEHQATASPYNVGVMLENLNPLAKDDDINRLFDHVLYAQSNFDQDIIQYRKLWMGENKLFPGTT